MHFGIRTIHKSLDNIKKIEYKSDLKKYNIRITVTALLAIIILGCKDNTKTEQPFTVQYKGALKNIMHKGDLSAKTDLLEYKNIKNLYALGAIENLKGEIQIFNGVPYNSYVENGHIKFDTTFSKRATLFVKSIVKDWYSIMIPNSITYSKDFERHLKKSATEKGIDTDQPFPFKIEGIVSKIDWHVINWKDGDSSGLNGSIENEKVEMLGFYSNSHHAIFTHHTTNIHMHMKSFNNKIAGHVDEFILGDNMILKLPKN